MEIQNEKEFYSLLRRLYDIKVIRNSKFITSYLKKGSIFMGFCVDDKTNELRPKYVLIKDFSHHLIRGVSGRGKSVLLKFIMASVIYNLDDFEAIYCMDFKYGIEFQKYGIIDDKFKIIDSMEDFEDMVNEIEVINEERARESRKFDKEFSIRKPILVVIDEFAMIENFKPRGMMEMVAHRANIVKLTTIAMKARSQNIKIISLLQKRTTDNMNSSYKQCHQSKIMMKQDTEESITACMSESEILKELGVNRKTFPYGRYVYKCDIGSTISYFEMQSLFIENDWLYYIYDKFVKNKKKSLAMIEREEHVKEYGFDLDIEQYLSDIYNSDFDFVKNKINEKEEEKKLNLTKVKENKKVNLTKVKEELTEDMFSFDEEEMETIEKLKTEDLI